MDGEAEDDFEDGEYPETPDDDDSAEVLPCPACGELIYEEAQQCPACGQYVTHSTSPWAGRPVAWIVLGLLGILAVLYVFLWNV